MGFFDKFKKKKKQEEADEEIISQTEAEQAEAADDSVPGRGSRSSTLRSRLPKLKQRPKSR